MWNVKCSPYVICHATDFDLIDTLWNVKSTEYTVPQIAVADLIDTLWNVKVAVEPEAVVAPFRFNRYIVECKGIAGSFARRFGTGFNRYIVECKEPYRLGSLEGVYDLIDTLWNVKLVIDSAGFNPAAI